MLLLKLLQVGGQLSELCVERGAENQIVLKYAYTHIVAESSS